MIRAIGQTPEAHWQQAVEARFGLRIAASLEDVALHSDIKERLRVAREQALARARTARRLAEAPAVVQTGGGTVALGGTPWWLRLAAIAPLMVLALGLILIERLDSTEQIRAAAEIDAVLLADDLPPRAYSDPGFTEYLKQGTP